MDPTDLGLGAATWLTGSGVPPLVAQVAVQRRHRQSSRWVVLGSGVSCCASREHDLHLPMITDDDALLMDGLIGRLRNRYPESGNVIIEYYRSRNIDLKTVGSRLGFGYGKTQGLWKAGVAWIDGALDIRRNAA